MEDAAALSKLRHARRVIAIALRDLRRRADGAERERDRAHEEIDEHASAIERADEMRATVAKLERERDAYADELRVRNNTLG